MYLAAELIPAPLLYPRTMRLLDEIRRRKVARVAVVRGVGALAVLQAADLLAEGLRSPDSVFTAVTVIVIAGFPIALVLGWILRLTAEPSSLSESALPGGERHEAQAVPSILTPSTWPLATQWPRLRARERGRSG